MIEENDLLRFVEDTEGSKELLFPAIQENKIYLKIPRLYSNEDKIQKQL